MISVVTINYNNAPGLRRTLESLNEQDDQNYEVIIIDGASVDESYDEYFKLRNQKMKWFSEPDMGIYDAMNKGLDKIQGEFFMFVNSGDVLENNSVIKRYRKSIDQSYTRPQIIYSGVNFFNADTLRVERTWKSRNFRRWKLFTGWMPPHPGFTISTEYFMNHRHKFNTDYSIAADYGFMLRYLLNADPSKVLNLNTISISMENGGVSNNSLYSVVRANLQVLKIWRDQIGFYPIWIFIYKPLSKIIQLWRNND